MSDLNEKLAQEAAELINGGEWRDGKWYSDGHRDAWRRALKPAASRIEKLEDELHHCFHRINALQTALRIVINWDSTLESEDGLDWGEVMDIASKALEGKDD